MSEDVRIKAALWCVQAGRAAFNDLHLSLLEIKTNGFKLAFSCPVIILPNPRHLTVLEQMGTTVKVKRELQVLLFIRLFREVLACQNL